MNKLTEIFKEIGLVNEKFFRDKTLTKEEYQKELKPIFSKLKQTIAECKKYQIKQ